MLSETIHSDQIGLPPSDKVQVGQLAGVFRNTTNAYKYYWFRSILSLVCEGAGPFLDQQALTNRMFEQVWYPIDYFKLSFGKLDSFVTIARVIRAMPKGELIDNSPGSPSVINQIESSFTDSEKRIVHLQLNKLWQYVPFRFLRPFLDKETKGVKDSQVDRKIMEEARRYATADPSHCPYSFVSGGIHINNVWFDYFRKHLSILEGFANWHLVQYLQRNNPNIAGLSVKIFKPEERQLNSVRQAWNVYRQIRGILPCIYSNESLGETFTLDHFIPWSFIAHDLNWNLTPVSREINSRKNDRLPALDLLPRLAALQYDFVQTVSEARGVGKVLEDYTLLFRNELAAIKAMSLDRFTEEFRNTFTPLYQIAKNAGFRDWN